MKQFARSKRGMFLLAGVALLVGIAMRIQNALEYTLLWGFDSYFNWQYIVYLTKTWTLPAPDALWSSAHPPFYYYFNTVIVRLLDNPNRAFNVITLRFVTTLAGLVTVGMAYAVVRRADPDNWGRALLAGGLILFLPVHIYMSAMLTEEIFVTALISLTLAGLTWEFTNPSGSYTKLRFAAGLGVIVGLAFLTKLTGVLIAVAAAGAYLVDGWRKGALVPALQRASILVLMTALVGGWYYARNLLQYGYLYPHGLQTHKIMFTMPPGVRHLSDYFYLPLATWTDPQVLHPDLLRSVWGSTFASMWFDGHRVFLPRDVPAVTRAGTFILTLALLPMSALAVGIWRGVKRALTSPKNPDTLFLLIGGITIAGYLYFTWRNPWFVTLKASFLLSLSIPFAFYTSETLDRWLHRKGPGKIVVAGVLIALTLAITCTFTYSEIFWNTHHMTKPGVVW